MMGFETAVLFSMNGLGPFSFSLKAVWFAHGICFLFLFPVQTVKNKSKAPDIILLQQWGDVFIL